MGRVDLGARRRPRTTPYDHAAEDRLQATFRRVGTAPAGLALPGPRRPDGRRRHPPDDHVGGGHRRPVLRVRGGQDGAGHRRPHRDVGGSVRARDRVRDGPSLHRERRWRDPRRMGGARGRHGRGGRGHRPKRTVVRGRGPDQRSGREGSRAGRPRIRYGARGGRGAPRPYRGHRMPPEDHLPPPDRPERAPGGVRERHRALEDPERCGEDQLRPVEAPSVLRRAGLHRPVRRDRAGALGRIPGDGVRGGSSGDPGHAPVLRRRRANRAGSIARSGGRARHLPVHAVGAPRMVGGAASGRARGLRGPGDRRVRGARAGVQGVGRGAPGDRPPRHGAGMGPDRRQHLPRRAVGGPTVPHAAGPGIRRLPNPHRRPLSVLERHPRGWRRDRDPRVQLRAGDPFRSKARTPPERAMKEPYSFPFYVASWYRKSPYWQRTVEAGCTSWDLYNHMLIPTLYDDDETEYWHLLEHVTLWDVAVERQVEITGRDAAAFTQLLTCRDLSRCAVGQCKYSPLIAPDGGIVNDPVLLRVGEDHFWLSLADSDAMLYALGVQAFAGIDVTIREPDVSPLQVQGPQSKDVIRALFGDEVADLRYYWCVETDVDGIPVVVSRTGWTGEVGYEIYLRDSSRGLELWDRVMEAGAPYKIRAIAPSDQRRLEAGIFNYGNDMTIEDNPFEVTGMERLVEFSADFIGRPALERIAAQGVTRKLVGVEIGGEPIRLWLEDFWPVRWDGRVVGKLTSASHSFRLKTNIGYAWVPIELAGPGNELVLVSPDGPVPAMTAALPFLDPRSEEHTSELQSHHDLVCRLLLEKKKKNKKYIIPRKKKKHNT